MRTERKHRLADDERELLEVARSFFSEAFPNPERLGCPQDYALKLLALRPTLSDESVSEHVSYCSPCFNSYMEHLRKAKKASDRASSRRLIWWKFAGAAVAVTCFLITISILPKRIGKPDVARPASSSSDETSGRAKSEKYLTVFIDFSNAAPVRGAEQSREAAAPQVLPSGSWIDLNVRLPFGSDEHLYSITLRDAKQVLWTAMASSHIEHGDTFLHVRADFTNIVPGAYDFEVKSESSLLRTEVLVKKANSEPRQ